jgi:hypothetical protein
MGINWRHAKWRVAGALGHNADDSKYDPASRSAVYQINCAFGYHANNNGSLIMSYPDGLPT